MNLTEFKQSGKSLIIFHASKEIYASEEEALEPLVRFIQLDLQYENLVIFDKYIGRAAAMLMTLLKPEKVYTPVISQFGREIFESARVVYEAEEEVEYLMGVASESMCKWEKLSVGKTAIELYDLLKM